MPHRIPKHSFAICLLLLCSLTHLHAQQSLPIIDVHLHASHANSAGPPPSAICAPYDRWPSWDPKDGMANYAGVVSVHPPCAKPLLSPKTDEELMQKTLAILQQRNVTAVASGPTAVVDRWKQAGSPRILPALYFDVKTGKPSVAELRELVQQKHPVAFAEIDNQYLGIGADDPRMEPYYALAEELDIPIGLHTGPGPPGTPYFFEPTYRMRFSSMLLLEDVLVRHPRLRIWAMHAGWPLGDDAIAAMYAHPQLFVDTASSTTLSRALPSTAISTSSSTPAWKIASCLAPTRWFGQRR